MNYEPTVEEQQEAARVWASRQRTDEERAATLQAIQAQIETLTNALMRDQRRYYAAVPHLTAALKELQAALPEVAYGGTWGL